MPSLHPNFNYDIFVSYRHNDNRSGWVAGFVKALQEELAATIKEPMSVYFDTNTHDGLLETHHVDKSLEGKLRCLILIPIISQTYCDPKSFAWKYEFCAFNELANSDAFGRDVTLANGNVASRILPVRIHDLDTSDKTLLENQLGGPLRPIDFIYREAGVNRPLLPEDKKEDNLNKTAYRNQINKAANAVKDLVAAIQSSPDISKTTATRSTTASEPVPGKKNIGLVVAVVSILAALVIGFVGYSFFGGGKTDIAIPIDRSIAVLPFVDMSQAKDQEYFSDGLTEELLNVLANVPGLKVIARTSSFSFKGKNEDLVTIGHKLGVAHILEGSVRKAGDKIRVTAQLISVADGTHLWSQTYERTMDDIFKIQDQIAAAVVKELKAKIIGATAHQNTQNTEAYNLYLEGRYFSDRRSAENCTRAIEKFKAALVLDPGYANAWAGIATTYYIAGSNGYIPNGEAVKKAREAVANALRLDPLQADAYVAQASIYLTDDLDWSRAEASLKKAIELDSNNSASLTAASGLYADFGNMDEAIALSTRAIAKDPLMHRPLLTRANAYFSIKHFDEAEADTRTALELQPDFAFSHYFLSLIQVAQGKSQAALESILKEPDTDIWRYAGLPIVYYSLNRKAESDAALQTLITKYGNGGGDYQIAEAYAFCGEPDKAFQWLASAYEKHDPGLTQAKTDPLLEKIRGDQRWKALIKKMGLE